MTVSDIIPEKLPEDAACFHRPESTAVLYVSGPLYFGSVRRLEESLRDLHGKERLIFSLRGVPLADLSAVQAVADLCRGMINEGTEVYFTCLQPGVEEMFEKCGLKHIVGEERFYWSTDQAIRSMA